MDQDWRKAIAKYDQDVADGTIAFGTDSIAADSYPGKDQADASLADWMNSHIVDD